MSGKARGDAGNISSDIMRPWPSQFTRLAGCAAVPLAEFPAYLGMALSASGSTPERACCRGNGMEGPYDALATLYRDKVLDDP